MKCSNCGSENTTVQLFKKDKKDRNKNILLISILVIVAIFFVAGDFSWISAMIGLFISMPLLMILSIVLRFIPAGTITYIVCNDCGKKSKTK